jgi:hypothetical protein
MQMVGLLPCLEATCIIMSNGILSKTPSVSRKATKAICLCSVSPPVAYHHIGKCSFSGFQFGRHVGFDAEETPVIHHP